MGKEPSDSADSVAPCPWIYGDLEGSRPVAKSNNTQLFVEQHECAWGGTHESQNVS
jgi:hypothetical protein